MLANRIYNKNSFESWYKVFLKNKNNRAIWNKSTEWIIIIIGRKESKRTIIITQIKNWILNNIFKILKIMLHSKTKWIRFSEQYIYISIYTSIYTYIFLYMYMVLFQCFYQYKIA